MNVNSGASAYSQSVISGSSGTDAGTPTATPAPGGSASTPATESPLAGLQSWDSQSILDRLTGKTSAPPVDANGLTQKPTDAASSTADALGGSADA